MTQGRDGPAAPALEPARTGRDTHRYRSSAIARGRRPLPRVLPLTPWWFQRCRYWSRGRPIALLAAGRSPGLVPCKRRFLHIPRPRGKSFCLPKVLPTLRPERWRSPAKLLHLVHGPLPKSAGGDPKASTTSTRPDQTAMLSAANLLHQRGCEGGKCIVEYNIHAFVSGALSGACDPVPCTRSREQRAGSWELCSYGYRVPGTGHRFFSYVRVRMGCVIHGSDRWREDQPPTPNPNSHA